jgi:fructoselysine-6-P-deglycase FrlB-like protein
VAAVAAVATMAAVEEAMRDLAPLEVVVAAVGGSSFAEKAARHVRYRAGAASANGSITISW